MTRKNQLRAAILALTVLLACSAGAFAQDLPKSIDVYVPARAGGGTDVMARTLSNQISKVAGSTMVILNNVDGNGVVAMETVRNAKPDGKTIMQFHTTMIIQSAMGKYKYNLLDDFTIIGVAKNPILGKNCGGKEIKDSFALTDLLLSEVHVAVIPGCVFGDDRYIRLSYATSMENIIEGLNRIEKFTNKIG